MANSGKYHPHSGTDKNSNAPIQRLGYHLFLIHFLCLKAKKEARYTFISQLKACLTPFQATADSIFSQIIHFGQRSPGVGLRF